MRDHNLREGFHALYALAAYRDSERARELAEASIQVIFDYWAPSRQVSHQNALHRISRTWLDYAGSSRNISPV